MEKQSFLEVLLQPWLLQGHSLLLAALGWTVVHVVSGLLFKSVAPLGRQAKDDRPLRVCATLHAIVACTLAVVALLETDSPIHKDRLHGVSPTSHLLHIISVGYFLWDVVVVLLYGEGFGFLLHAVGCLFMFSNCHFPYIQYYGCIFLLYELSTPFLHLRGLLINAKRTDGMLFQAAQFLFALTFFIVRIAIGWPTLIGWIQDMWGQYQSGQAHSELLILIYLFFGLSLNILNIYWFALIVKNALGRGSPRSERSKGEKAKQ